MAVDFERDVYCLLGLPFDAVDVAGVVRRLRQVVRDRRRCFLSTPNLNFVVACRTDSEFHDSVVHSDLSIADGMPLVWVARLLGIPIRGRIAGSSVFEALRRDKGERMSVFLFGGPDGVAETACRRLDEGPTGLICAGFESPGYGSIDDMSSNATIEKINSSDADFLVVSLGARKGQAWIMRNYARLGAPIISHLGAVPNFIAGTVGRAPVWMQRAGLEWLWRIKEEPKLWRRYFGDGLCFLWLLVTRVLPYAWYLHWHNADAVAVDAASVESAAEEQNYTIRLQGAWTRSNIAVLRDCFSRAVLAETDLRLDMGGVTYVDSAFIGLVMLLHGHQSHHGRRLLIVSLQNPVRQIIRYCCAEYLCLT